jgi:hypothetical protein
LWVVPKWGRDEAMEAERKKLGVRKYVGKD